MSAEARSPAPRLGKDVWADLEAAMHLLARHIRAADPLEIEAAADRVRDLADEMGDAINGLVPPGSRNVRKHFPAGELEAAASARERLVQAAREWRAATCDCECAPGEPWHTEPCATYRADEELRLSVDALPEGSDG